MSSSTISPEYEKSAKLVGSKPNFANEKESKYFEFKKLEAEIYQWWEESGYFKPSEYNPNESEPFVLPMPPPNVTGYLHMGHAIFVALQDIMARFHRMRGRPTLWLPGTYVLTSTSATAPD
jgi:valyl-tRNA synthetase